MKILGILAAMVVCGIGAFVAAFMVLGFLGTVLHDNYEYYAEYLPLCLVAAVAGFLAPVALVIWLGSSGRHHSSGRLPAAAGPPDAVPAPISDLRGYAKARVAGPATALMVFGAFKIGLVTFALAILVLADRSFAPDVPGVRRPWANEGQLVALAGIPVQVLLSLIVIVGARKMKRLESYRFAVASAILAILPSDCLSWSVGMACGVWSLVALWDANVNAAFRLDRTRGTQSERS